MKNVSSVIVVLVLFLIIPACTGEKIAPVDKVEKKIIIPNEQSPISSEDFYLKDTVITFNPETKEEKITNIITYQMDTIITFDTTTYEENMQIVKTIISNETF